MLLKLNDAKYITSVVSDGNSRQPIHSARLFSLFYSVFIALLLYSLTSTASLSDDGTLVLGRVSKRPEMAMHDLKAMSSYLRTVLPNGQQIKFTERVVPNLSEMLALVKSGEVDLLSETPMGMIALEQNAGAEILLHEWKKGTAEYASLLIARADSETINLDSLVDHVIAFEDPGSTSGFLMPLAMPRKKGYTVELLQARGQKPSTGSIGYIFATHEINIASLVTRGIVHAGAISDLNWNDPEEVPPGFKKRLAIIHSSALVLRSAVVIGGHVSTEMKKTLYQAFSQMHKTIEGRRAMKVYHGVSLFTPITEEISSQIAELRLLYEIVKGEIR